MQYILLFKNNLNRLSKFKNTVNQQNDEVVFKTQVNGYKTKQTNFGNLRIKGLL